MTEPQLQAVRLTRRFGAVLAVDDVSFEVAPGQVVGLLGANGAGKTTAIRMLLGLLAPTAGVARLLGGAPSRTTRRSLGYVPQGLGLWRDLSVHENLAFIAQAYGFPPCPLPPPLEGSGDHLVRDLPLGLQRQVAFLCATQHSPSVLVLDEPTSGVEPLTRTRLWDTVRAEADRGVGVLVTTHYMQEARQCDHLLLMSRGRLVASGTERDVVAGTRVVAIHAEDWERVFTLLSEAGEAVMLAGRTVRVVDGDLDRLAALLREHGVAARTERVAASIEERMTALAGAPLDS